MRPWTHLVKGTSRALLSLAIPMRRAPSVSSFFALSRSPLVSARIGAERPWWRVKWISGEEFSSLAKQTAAIVAALHFLGAYIIHVSVCVGPSMIPTFRASGDLVLIDKISSSRLVGRRYRTGDVVIAWAPYDPERMVCKRIAGVAGDVVTIIDDEGDVEKDNKTTNGLNSVGISGVAESGPLLSVGRSSEAGSAKDSGDRTSSPASEAQGVGGTVHIGSPTGFNDNPVSRKLKRAPLQVRVPPGHVWLVGDNAANSRDSRNYGPVSECLIQGRVVAKVWWPPKLIT